MTLLFVFHDLKTREKEKENEMKKKSFTFSGKCQLSVFILHGKWQKSRQKMSSHKQKPIDNNLDLFPTRLWLAPVHWIRKNVLSNLHKWKKLRQKKGHSTCAHHAWSRDRSNDKYASILIFIAIMNAVAQQPHRCGIIQNNFRF